MTAFSLCLFGPFLITHGDVPLRGFRSSRERALLAFLATESNRPHARSALAELVWEGYSAPSALKNLRNTLSHLRSLLSLGQEGDNTHPLLSIDHNFVQFNADSILCSVDVLLFDGHIAWCAAHSHPNGNLCPECHVHFVQALALYRGDCLADLATDESVAFEDWRLLQQETRHSQAIDALGKMAAYAAAQTDYPQVELYARRWLALEPWNEAAHRHLIRSLAQQGQRGQALHQYETCRRILAAELTVEPDEETERLVVQIRRGDFETKEAPIRLGRDAGAPEPPPFRLPAQNTPFIGRSEEVAVIARTLENPNCRLLTLTGPGGIGKTRLALAVAEHLRQAQAAGGLRFPDGIFFASLAPLQESSALAAALTETLQAPLDPSGGATNASIQERLLGHLANRHIFLILDNLEHLPEATDLIAAMLAAAPGLRVLATSRGHLDIPQEYVYLVGGLPYPRSSPSPLNQAGQPWQAVEYPAAELLLYHIRRVQPNFSLDNRSVHLMQRICHWVEGMPLALEMAASWAGALSLSRIAEGIEQSLALLAKPNQNSADRHRTMRAVFESSWQRLSLQEQTTFAQLSVLRGSFSLEAAQAVAQAEILTVFTLIHHSFVSYNASIDRYTIHELLRQYGVEQLAHKGLLESQTCERQSDFFCVWLQRLHSEFLVGSRMDADLLFGREFENVRAAWLWAAQKGNGARLQLAQEGLFTFLHLRNRLEEALQLNQFAIAESQTHSTPDPRLLSGLLSWQGRFLMLRYQHEQARQRLEQALLLLEELAARGEDVRKAQADAFLRYGSLHYQIDLHRTKELYGRALALYQELSDRWQMAHAHSFLISTNRDLGDLAASEFHGAESLRLCAPFGNTPIKSESLQELARTLLMKGEFARAESCLQQSIALCREFGDDLRLAWGYSFLGQLRACTHDYAQAVALLEQSIAICFDLGRPYESMRALFFLALARMSLGEYAAMRRRIDEGWRILDDSENPLREARGRLCLLQGCWWLVQANPQEALQSLAQAYDIFTELGRPQSQVQTLGLLSFATIALGEREQAASCGLAALQGAERLGTLTSLAFALPAIARLLAEQGERAQAQALYGLAQGLPYVGNSPFFVQLVGPEIAGQAVRLSSQPSKQHTQQSRAALWQTVRVLLEELPRMGWVDWSGSAGDFRFMAAQRRTGRAGADSTQPATGIADSADRAAR
jgi:predicted ATPase/DNA-binding SARP family transcriptional activator